MVVADLAEAALAQQPRDDVILRVVLMLEPLKVHRHARHLHPTQQYGDEQNRATSPSQLAVVRGSFCGSIFRLIFTQNQAPVYL
eukprot:COSAG02_NODE_2977_length_7630_cov_6.628735_2_plen_84_part_00